MTAHREFQRPVNVDDIGAAATHAISADVAERQALARRFGLRALSRLVANLVTERVAAGIRVSGRVAADAVQICVVSCEDVPTQIDEAVDVLFVGMAGRPAANEEVELAATDCDLLPLAGRTIDLGELAAETLGLALDPYPHASDAELAEARRHLTSEEDARRAANPFSVLKTD
jgi:uncharacterized metal-binding protein YceD (DUF177 family)